MVQRPRFRASRLTRAFTLLVAAVLLVTLVPAGATEKIGDGVTPTYDEAYYATLDYYGNLTEGSVVKSYALNGATALTDHGTYDEVVNLTDGTVPTTKDGVTTFNFSSEDAPSHFYFEGKTAAPFTALPWTISMSYTLNGVPTKAEDLAGKTGEVDIHLDIVPNENASDYAKSNYTLEATALFNQDDILSLKAEGAQVQLVGNLRMVLFLALPGEEQHFTIQVGADDFTFDGMTFLMVPATLAQLDEIAELSDRKEELEDDYEKLNNSLDTTLDALNNMTGSLNASAKGLDELNEARDTISAGKGTIYDGIDTSKLDLESIAALLDPVAEQVQAASETLTESKDILQTMNDVAVSLQTELSQTRNALENLEDDGDDLKDLATDMKNLSGDLDELKNALKSIDVSTSSSSTDMSDSLDKVISLHDAFSGGDQVIGGDGTADELSDAAFVAALALANGEDATTASALASALSDNTSPYYDSALELDALHKKVGLSGDFETFCKAILLSQGESTDLASQMDQLWTIYNGGDADAAALQLITDQLDSVMGNVSKATSNANSELKKVARPTADVVGRLSAICDELDALYRFIDDAQDMAHIGQSATQKADVILSDMDALDNLLNAYEPKAQESLKTVEDLSVTAAGSIRNAEKLINDTEELARTSGEQLDAGTKQTLEGLASTLRRTAAALATSKDIKVTKDNLDGIITDTWDEHTGDVDNLLNMDNTAAAESLTSHQNPTPQSIQVLIRSEEIKVPDEDEDETAAATVDKGSFWSRVGQMFKDFWSAITGIFH
jgi:putative membrane protein